MKRKTKRHGTFILATVAIIVLIMFLAGKQQKTADYNFILISLDALRYDHLGLYGYGRNTSPNIDKLGERSTVFGQAITQATWTLPSHGSVFTSLYPPEHGLVSPDRNISPSVRTLAEHMKIAGYKTLGISAGQFTRGKYFGNGFDEYVFMPRVENSSSFLSWWLSNNSKNRFFVFFHVFKIHAPYVNPSPYDTIFDSGYNGSMIDTENELVDRIKELKVPVTVEVVNDVFWGSVNGSDRRDAEHLMDLYDGGILYTDTFIGKLVNRLRLLGIENKTVIIIFGDHGEAFGEHGSLTHQNLYDEVLRVPLIISVPATGGKRIEGQVQLIDIMPTVLELAGAKTDGLKGNSLVSAIFSNNSSASTSRYAYSIDNGGLSIRTPEWKLIERFNGSYELYDLKNDRLETENVAGKMQDIAARMAREISRWKGGNKYDSMRNASEQARKTLEASGYIPADSR